MAAEGAAHPASASIDNVITFFIAISRAAAAAALGRGLGAACLIPRGINSTPSWSDGEHLYEDRFNGFVMTCRQWCSLTQTLQRWLSIALSMPRRVEASSCAACGLSADHSSSE